jgi:hypothetical protein
MSQVHIIHWVIFTMYIHGGNQFDMTAWVKVHTLLSLLSPQNWTRSARHPGRSRNYHRLYGWKVHFTLICSLACHWLIPISASRNSTCNLWKCTLISHMWRPNVATHAVISRHQFLFLPNSCRHVNPQRLMGKGRISQLLYHRWSYLRPLAFV